MQELGTPKVPYELPITDPLSTPSFHMYVAPSVAPSTSTPVPCIEPYSVTIDELKG